MSPADDPGLITFANGLDLDKSTGLIWIQTVSPFKSCTPEGFFFENLIFIFDIKISRRQEYENLTRRQRIKFGMHKNLDF